MIALVYQLAPELWLLTSVIALFVASLRKDGGAARRWLPLVAGVGVIAAFCALGSRGDILYGSYRLDGLSQFFKLLIAAAFAVVACMIAVRKTSEHSTDTLMLLALSAWGLMLLTSTVELITMYMALELSAYSLYALIPLRGEDRRAAEAGVKYILFGAAVTAISLFGLSYILAAKHSTYLAALAAGSWNMHEAPLAVIGLCLFFAGFFYKLALFPFHFWCPDVYQGASNETAAFVATLPKLAAALALMRLCAMLSGGSEALLLFAMLGAASMTVGNLAALVQSDLKRMLGYSSVAHAGYLMLGMAAASSAGFAAASYYAAAYAAMNLCCFVVICAVAKNGENPTLADLDGLYKRSPALALALAASAFSLVGLPPTAGFTGKLLLLTSAWSRGWRWLVVVAVLNTALSIYYYLGMVRHAYTKETAGDVAAPRRATLLLGGALAAAVLLLGILPAGVYDLALRAARELHP